MLEAKIAFNKVKIKEIEMLAMIWQLSTAVDRSSMTSVPLKELGYSRDADAAHTQNPHNFVDTCPIKTTLSSLSHT